MHDTLSMEPATTEFQHLRAQQPDLLAQLVASRRALLVYANRHVSEPGVAQDLVQDTLEAALRGLQSFEGRSSVRTWAFAILRRHIADHYRRPRTTVALSVLFDNEDELDRDDALDRLLETHAIDHESLSSTRNTTPEAHLDRQQFWEQVELGVASLSTVQRRVFRLRDLLDQDAAQVSAVLGISPNHCHVTLHRARGRLRAFLGGQAEHGVPRGHARGL
jgi:RNA polymerase sigma-70 factor (ECF subfamily)